MSKPPVEEESAKLVNDRRAAYHKRLAIHVLLEQQKKVITDRIAANIKAADQEGLPGKKIKVTHKLAKEPPSKIAQHYKEELELLEFQGINLGAQFNIFGGVDVTPKKGPDFYFAGLTAGMDGKDGNPPKNLKGPDQQRWIEGWQDAVAARVLGQEYIDNLDAQRKAAENDGKPAEPEDGQVDLEEAIDASGVIRIGLSDFGPMAKLEDIELADLVLDTEVIEKARRIEVVDADNRVNILKNADGPMGIQDADWEASATELAAQSARPSTIAAKDPAAEDTKH